MRDVVLYYYRRHTREALTCDLARGTRKLHQKELQTPSAFVESLLVPHHIYSSSRDLLRPSAKHVKASARRGI